MTTEVKTALITGGARRIGRAIGHDLARAGFRLAIHCRASREKADALAAEIIDAGGMASVFQADLASPDETAAMFRDVCRTCGVPRLLVNNASVFEEDELSSFNWEGWERHFSLHLKAPVLLSRLLGDALPDEAGGLIVNMIDQRVWKLTPQFFTYTLSKAALWTATQTMAQALAPKIRVNAIGPGPALVGERQQQSDFDAQVEALLLKRPVALAEFGATIRYLWESPSVTGQMIALDGGQHLGWETPDVTGMRE